MKIAIAMSGGVDSSVSAALLTKSKSNETFGIYMKNWSDTYEEKTGACTWIEDRRDAMKVSAHLDIPFKTVDCEEEYRQYVLEYFYQEYQAGRTPNPDILCNRFMKFDVLWRHAAELGAEKMATGHYARVKQENDGTYALLKGIDTNKDQSYFLCRLTQEQLSRTLFPIGELTKPEVRALAKKFALPTATKKDSQGICFIGKVELREFLQFRLPLKAGIVLDTEGKEVGTHKGASSYTIGQRHGFTVRNTSAISEPWFVVETDVVNNTITIAQGRSHPALFNQKLNAADFHWIRHKPTFPLSCKAKIRYRQPDQICTVHEDGTVIFADKQRAVTPGQSIVFYQDDECIGSAIIQTKR